MGIIASPFTNGEVNDCEPTLMVKSTWLTKCWIKSPFNIGQPLNIGQPFKVLEMKVSRIFFGLIVVWLSYGSFLNQCAQLVFCPWWTIESQFKDFGLNTLNCD